MAKSKNYNVLRRGIGKALVIAAGARVLTACAEAPEPAQIQPPIVRVEIFDGEEMSSARTILHGCFHDKDQPFYDSDVGTLALADSVNGKPLTFKFTSVGTHKERILDQREVAKLTPYTPDNGEWYASSAGKDQSESAHCIQVLTGKEVPAQYDGRFAQVRYRADGPFSFYGPYDETSYMDNSCGPVTEIGGALFKMAETSIPNQGINPQQPVAPEDCQR